MARKKVLFHLMRPSIPCDTGDKRRSLGILKYLNSRKESFEVDIFSSNAYGNLSWSDQDRMLAQEYCQDLLIYEGQNSKIDFLYGRAKSLWYQKIWGEIIPVDSDYHTPIAQARFFRKLLLEKQYDYVWLTMLEYAQLVNQIPSQHRCQSILDMQDLCSEGRQVTLSTASFAQGLKFDYEKNFKKEMKVLNKFDKVVTNSATETEKISSYLPEEKTTLIPHPLGRNQNSYSSPEYTSRRFSYDILFVGTSRVANVEGIEYFINKVYPSVIQAFPEVTLALVGSVADTARFDASLEHNIKRIGFVEDLADVYLRSRIFICPLLAGAGTKVKLQEAIEFALPIVATPVGASGLILEDGVSSFIKNSPEELAASTISLLASSQRANQMSSCVKDVYSRYYSTEVIRSKLDHVFDLN